MIASSPSDFRSKVREHRLEPVALKPEVLDLARAAVAEAGLLVVGEPHGVSETASVLYSLAGALDTRAVAFEWSHEEMDAPLQGFLRGGSFDFDRLDREPAPEYWQLRDREMAERLMEQWDEDTPLLVLVGAVHAQLSTEEGETMATHLARRRPRLQPAMIDYGAGLCWSRGEMHDVAGPTPPAPIIFEVRNATPAPVPRRPNCTGAEGALTAS
ncbi:MAG: hypothetical protein ACRDLA_03975 [Thermoleophilaceae bacterium]